MLQSSTMPSFKNTSATQPKSRNPLKWPFASTSIWNTPIGSNARYVPANEYGYDFQSHQGDFFNDVTTLFGVLNVVDNNGPTSIGGGGTPRAPMAPSIDSSHVTVLQQLMGDPTVEDSFQADFNGDDHQDLLWRNLATGSNHVWLQNRNGKQVGGGNILPLTNPQWQIQGTPDVNQDGRFKLTGSQTWGNQDFDNYGTKVGWKTYEIPVGEYVTGDMPYLVLVNDHDVKRPNAMSQFRNIQLFEDTRGMSESRNAEIQDDPLAQFATGNAIPTR